MKLMYLDESGDHNLAVIDSKYPLFVLGGIIVDQAYAEGEMTERVCDFKRRLFGRDDLILHTADLTRNRNGFERMKDAGFREWVYRELNTFMRSLEYKVVACAIRKYDHLARYGVAALDPYLLSLDVLVERFSMEIGAAKEEGMIIAEKREPTLDRELELAWMNLQIKGTRYRQAHEIRKQMGALHLCSKSLNLAGLQIADLVVTPIGRALLGKTIKEDYEIVREKFRRGRHGEIEGYGLMVLPK